MDPSTLALVLCLGAIAGLMAVLILMLSRLRSMKREKDAIEGEEHRMFGFLHMLGLAIEEDYTPRKLYRVIVDGIKEVAGADGAALYLMSRDRQGLVPAHVTEGCPPLFELSPEQWKEIGTDPDRLTSFLRLALVPLGSGLPGRGLKGESGVVKVRDLPSQESGGDGAEGEALLVRVTHGARDLGVLVVVRSGAVRVFSGNDVDVLQSLAEQSSFALGNALIHQEAAEKRQIDRELKLAGDVQRVLLPASDPDASGYRIKGTNVPARVISGDYYDYIPLADGVLGVAIADVSGKGISAGLMMATCRSALRSLGTDPDSPASALAAVNRQLFPDMREDMFISMAYVILGIGSGRLRMARAGHDAPLMYRKASGEVEVLKPGGLAIGIDEGPVFERVTKDFETEFEAGDCLLLYTDGINEAENGSGEEFGRERLRATFGASAVLGAEATVEALQAELRAFVGEHRQMDDITLVAIEKR